MKKNAGLGAICFALAACGGTGGGAEQNATLNAEAMAANSIASPDAGMAVNGAGMSESAAENMTVQDGGNNAAAAADPGNAILANSTSNPTGGNMQ